MMSENEHRVADGDTFWIEGYWERLGRTGNVVRPYGYDTPEKDQPGYAEAKQKLKNLIHDKKITITKEHIIDHYGRLVANVDFKNII
jgi:endonuclease YncB( thermonuclease family)